MIFALNENLYMNRHKKLFFSTLKPFLPIVSLNRMGKILQNQMVLPLYHAVSDIVIPHLKHLYTIRSVKEFIADIDVLLDIGRAVTLKEIIDYTKGNTEFKTPVFHLTFDDGLREFHDFIAPVLLDKGVPATCFLNSAFIDNKELFYRFKSSLLIERLHSSVQGSGEWKGYHNWHMKNNLKQNYYKDVLLSVKNDERPILDELANEIGLNFSEYLEQERPYMTSDQIKSLIKKGFTFGAHSIDHPDYHLVSEDEGYRQTETSIKQICKAFNLGYRVFSFPYTDDGVPRSYFNRLEQDNLVDLSFGCAGFKRDSVSTNIQRIPVEMYQDSMNNILKKEIFYFKFLTLLGKNTIFHN